MPIGCKVTLRGERMYEFLDRLVNLALPRVRDFRGVSPDSFDGRGNYALGIKEQLFRQQEMTEHISSKKILINHLSKLASEQRRRAVWYQRVREELPHIMNQVMRFFSICYQM